MNKNEKIHREVDSIDNSDYEIFEKDHGDENIRRYQVIFHWEDIQTSYHSMFSCYDGLKIESLFVFMFFSFCHKII